LSFVADNRQKGVSATSAMTIHANAAWSEAHWNDDAKATIAALLAEAGPFLGNAIVVESQLKKWRFATPRTLWPDACWLATSGAGPVVIAGDAFAGPRVEGAVLSGLAASRALLDR
jgi:predicted NAD/FAD-dependent oxidoreductase